MERKLLTIGLLSFPLMLGLGFNVAQAATLSSSAWRAALPERAAIIRVGERFERRPLHKGVQPEPRSPEVAKNAIVTNLQTEFEKATGSSDHILTKQAAADSGWGWAADHFDAIDSQKRGAVSLDDVLNYVSRTARIALPRPAASIKAIQIVH